MNFLFEQTRKNDYEYFVHFKDYEQNIWNLGHPFFHHFTLIFDQDNQEIGIDGKNILSLKDEVENVLKKKNCWIHMVETPFISFVFLVNSCCNLLGSKIFWYKIQIR